MWLHPEESLADGDEAGDVRHPRRIEVLQLQTPLIEESAQEPVRGVSQPALMEGEKGNHLVGTRLRELLLPGDPPVCHLLRQQKPLRDESLQHRLIHSGRPPVRHFAPNRKGSVSSSLLRRSLPLLP